MTSSPPVQRARKQPAERRAEIIAAATNVALTEGLECITLRRIADKLHVRPGTIGHYFPVAEDLVAETFGMVAEAELLSLIPPEEGLTPTERLRRFLSRALSAEFHDVNRLWLNARHLARYRPALRARVIVQGNHWRERLTSLIQSGVDDGSFRAERPEEVALRILVAIDGLSADLNADPKLPCAVRRMATDVAEHELNLSRGTLQER